MSIPHHNDSGGAYGLAPIMQDRDGSKSAEDAANDALKYAQGIVDTVREPLIVLDGSLRVQTANRSFYQTFKVCQDDTEGRLLFDLGNRQWDIPLLRNQLQEILTQDSFFNDFEVTHDFPAIGTKVMLLNARRICGGSSVSERVLLAIEDITERRSLEKERQELETSFTLLVKNIRDHSIFTLDTEGRITSWNQEATRILGFGEAEVMGQHFSLIFTWEDREAGIPALELSTALSQGRAEDERWHLRKSGERFWALGIVSPTHDTAGQHTGYSKILRDMTDRKMADDALRLADRRKDEFLATLAHELRNPLAPIRHGLQLLKLTSDPALAEEVLSMMERQLGQMVRLVDDLLDASRITRNKLSLHKSRIELKNVLQNALETARPQIESNGHALAITLPDHPVYVDGDLTRLAQAFCNLLNNSAKYTESGGCISLNVVTDATEVTVTVRDNGIGIPAESLPELFEMFAQVDRSLERAEGGLGIGLALVKGLIQAHDGSVSVHSDGVGKGSTFIVRLPICQDEPVAEDCIRPASRPNPRRKILVVDDNRDAAESLAMLLTLKGNETQIAHDGLEALELAEAFRPDLIVLDIGLPKLNGYDTCGRIREKRWGRDILIVAATGWNQEEDRRRSSEAGFDHHLVKPIDTSMLDQLLAERTKGV